MTYCISIPGVVAAGAIRWNVMLSWSPQMLRAGWSVKSGPDAMAWLSPMDNLIQRQRIACVSRCQRLVPDLRCLTGALNLLRSSSNAAKRKPDFHHRWRRYFVSNMKRKPRKPEGVIEKVWLNGHLVCV